MNSKALEAMQAMTVEAKKDPKVLNKDYLSWGLTLLNLATYGRTNGGIRKGGIYRIAGKSSSGKTFLARMVLAEAAINTEFADYDLIYDDVEYGALMDTEKFFGKTLVSRLVPPAKKNGIDTYSRTLGDFYDTLIKKLKGGDRVIWIEDSMDALVADNTTKMTDGKAKMNSQRMRELLDLLNVTGSILVIISQAHVDMRSMFGGDTAAGGRALEFYSTLDIWLTKAKAIKQTYQGKDYVVGHQIMAKIKKNRLSGQDRMIYFPFYPSLGIDDIGANVGYLTNIKFWKVVKGVGIVAPEFEFRGSRATLIRKIEQEDLQRELQIVTGKAWKAMQEALTPDRKAKYQ